MHERQLPPPARQRAAAARRTIKAAAWTALMTILVILPSRAAAEVDYKQLLANSFLFYEAQQSGILPDWNRMARSAGGWRSDAHKTDGSAANLELSGGLYAQGGYVKATIPVAYTASQLAWAFLEFPKVCVMPRCVMLRSVVLCCACAMCAAGEHHAGVQLAAAGLGARWLVQQCTQAVQSSSNVASITPGTPLRRSACSQMLCLLHL
jgi:hypothetical protein